MKKQFFVLDMFDTPNHYIVDDVNALITEMYAWELKTNTFETVKGWFDENHTVFEIEGTIKQIQ
jgi:hypothetical protein